MQGAAAALCAIVLLAAHRALWLTGAGLPAPGAAERFFHAPEQTSPLLVIALCGWLVWNRRQWLRGADMAPATGLALAFFVPALALHAWVEISGAWALLLVALALELLAFAALVGGRRAVRALRLPALVLLLGIPIPGPLHNEVVWQLQKWTCAGAGGVLSLAGFEVRSADALLRIGDRAFVVVEACSGLRGIELLLLCGLAVRELFAHGGRRMWWVVGAAPPLALLMNVLRVASIPLGEDRGTRVAIAEGHFTQGIVVTVVGTFVLYGLGLWLSRHTDASAHPQEAARAPLRRPSIGALLSASGLLLAVVLVGAVGAAQRREPDAGARPASTIPMRQAAWHGEEARPDRLLIGELALDPIVARRYEERRGRGPRRIVDVFVGHEDPAALGRHPFSSKLVLPGAEWSIERIGRERVWALGAEVVAARVRSGSARALVYQWNSAGDPFWRETLLAIVGLDVGSGGGEPRRAVVRLTAPIERAGPLAEDRAKQALDAFAGDFRDRLPPP